MHPTSFSSNACCIHAVAAVRKAYNRGHKSPKQCEAKKCIPLSNLQSENRILKRLMFTVYAFLVPSWVLVFTFFPYSTFSFVTENCIVNGGGVKRIKVFKCQCANGRVSSFYLISSHQQQAQVT